MHKIYLLLRNNKQHGPYTLEELVQQNLLPSDLIWVEGRSAGWHNPQELAALRTHVRGFTPPPTPESTEATQARDRSLMDGMQPLAPAQIPLPSARHIYISLPAGQATLADPEPVAETDGAENEALSPEEKLERKARALYQRIQAFADNKTKADEDGELNTKYVRSLDDMKQEYANWLYQQKKKKKNLTNRKRLVITALTLVIATTGFGIVSWMTNHPRLGQELKKQPVELLSISATPTVYKDLKEAAQDEVVNETAGPRIQLIPGPENEEVLPQATQAATAPANGNKPIAGAAPRKPAARQSVQKDTNLQNFGVAAPAVQPQSFEPAPAVPVAKPASPAQPLAQLIRLDARYNHDKRMKNLNGLDVVLHNNSNEMLKQVEVDVLYYRKEDKVVTRERLYFMNVPPQGTSTIAAPVNRKATSARLQLGLVTRQDGSFYIR